METEKKNSKNLSLKHLGFVRVAAIQILASVSNLYDYAKQNSGSLKSAVEKVEGAVTTVVTPVYHKLKDVPDSLLVFLDHKVGEASYKFDKHAPPMAKQAVTQAHVLIYKATEKAQSFVKEARTGGLKAAFNFAATEYKCFVVTSSVKVWAKINQYKPIHAVGEKALPVAAHVSTRYNELVTDMTQMGYSLVGYLPLVPVDDFVKAYEKEDAEQKKKKGEDTATTDGKKGETTATTDGNESSSDSD
ncbi:PREDICTED: REF/SRPP-like protein At1g67360 [Camelina sativa]|uniref:REF/SRPP-like protein At1g67360 n=1 Tax=Camelina sativa TaxID=90675 RepID=A0ABM0SS03_CAMSA|nr:PREDICTED: REF/SRPP-like protein At1g67360 [Camelina sativa]